MLLLFLFGRTLLGFFTADQEIISIGVSLLALNLILQPCKMLNMAMGNCLNAIGDTRYTMVVSIISMSLIGVGGSYLFGISAGWGLVGIYCCMIADEAARGLLVLRRWRGQKVLREAEAQAAGDSRYAAGSGARFFLRWRDKRFKLLKTRFPRFYLQSEEEPGVICVLTKLPERSEFSQFCTKV